MASAHMLGQGIHPPTSEELYWRACYERTAAERDQLREQIEKLNLDLIGTRLERGEIRQQLDAYALELAKTVNQRDELLSACKTAKRYFAQLPPDEPTAAELTLDAAIAKV